MKRILIGTLFTFYLSTTTAYEAETTHFTLSGVAIDRSELAVENGILRRLGFESYEEGRFALFGLPGENSLREIFQFGAVVEDHVGGSPPEARVVYHFLDPQNNVGLTIDAVDFLGAVEFESSPAWALEDDGEAGPPQLASYRDARASFLRSLSDPMPIARRNSFAQTVRRLGQVAHHIQDMAQPQHVRNEIHCSARVQCDWLLESFTDQKLYRPSRYEAYISAQNDRVLSGNIATTTYPVGSVSTAAQFLEPRDFWVNPRVPLGGMAEFTSVNFLTKDTIPRWNPARNLFQAHEDFPLPSGAFFAHEFVPCNKSGVLGSRNGVCGNLVSLISDPVSNQSHIVPVARLSWFWAPTVNFFLSSNQGDRFLQFLYTVNDIEIYERQFELLAPRAVAFTTGLINYFFRGRVDLVFDPEFPNYWVRIKNAGDEPVTGEFLLYAENENGTRDPLSGWTGRTLSLQPGELSTPISFDPDAHIARYALTFEGQMGLEGHLGYNSLTAVAGSVKEVERVTIKFGDFYYSSGISEDIFRVDVFSAATTDQPQRRLHSENPGIAASSVEFSMHLTPGQYLVELTWLNPPPDPQEISGHYRIEFSPNIVLELPAFPFFGDLKGASPKVWWHMTVPYGN